MAGEIIRVRQIAQQARHEFESGLVSDDEIIDAAVALDAVARISSNASTVSEHYRKVGIYNVQLPLYTSEIFPKGSCNNGALIIAQRLVAADVLEGTTPEIICGGYGEDLNSVDPTSYYHNYHVFLGIGDTEVGRDTIVDITADQFDPREAKVYVGPIRKPWTRDPRIDLWEA